MHSRDVLRIFAAVMVYSLAGKLHSQTPRFDWTLIGGGTGYDEGYAVAVDSSGNAIVTGAAADPISIAGRTFSGTNHYAMLTKLNATGGVVWLDKLIWPSTPPSGGIQRDIAVDPHGNIYVCGGFQGSLSMAGSQITAQGESDGYVAKFDGQGQLLWVRNVSGDGFDFAYSLVIDLSGNCCVLSRLSFTTTVFEGNAATNANGERYSIALVKLSPDGVKLHTKLLGLLKPDIPTGEPTAISITMDRFGNTYICGFLLGLVSFDGMAIGGAVPLENNGNLGGGAFLVKLDADWKVLWAKDMVGPAPPDGGGTFASFEDVKADQDGNCFVIGSMRAKHQLGAFELSGKGKGDIVVAKFSPLGEVLWAREAGGQGNDSGQAIVIDSQGNCLAIGYFQGTAAFAGTTLTSHGIQDLFAAQYDRSGQLLWIRQLGAAEAAYFGLGVDLDNKGNAYLVGGVVYHATLTDNGFVSNEMTADILVARLNIGAVDSGSANSSLAKLQVIRDADNIVITWPTTAGDMLLETASSPDANTSWQPVAKNDESSSDRFVLRLEPGKTAAFFRLRSKLPP